MVRSEELEILDSDRVAEDEVARSYRELRQVHRWLGNTGAILRLLRQATRSSHPPRRILDIGCGQGALLAEIRDRLCLDVIGFDMRPAPGNAPVRILTGNAVTDPLPRADIAICVAMAHHLSEDELAELIRNVSRSADRFILLDLVRHPVPLALFRAFVAPFLCRINALDGQTSVRRAFTAPELHRIVDNALAGIARPTTHLRHKVSPFWIRQIVDIQWQRNN